MRLFLTGATGFIGSAIVPELIGAGHTVIGLARSDEGAERLKVAGAEVHRGELEDLESLKSGAAKADGVIHCAFVHNFSSFEDFKKSGDIDKAAIEAMGDAMAGTNHPLIVTGGIGLLAPGKIATETDDADPNSPMPRVSEQVGLAQAAKGVRPIVIRLPQVHDPVKQGLVTYLVAIARQRGVSAYVGDGANRWPAAHVLDVARLYRLALENNVSGAKYHAVDEEGVACKEMAEALGRGLKMPVKSISQEEAGPHFGFLSMFAALDLPASSAITRRELGWKPTGPGMIEDLNDMKY
ncbi:MAG: SDR family oxidoreductase [Acidobacteriaceae bacterium]